MFCPVCKYEFRRGFTHCNTCDVDLVDALPLEEEIDHTPTTSAPQQQLDRPVLLWSGASGGFYSALTVALNGAHVPYNKEELDARMVFTTQHVDLEVWVPAANLSEAQVIRDGLLANPFYANEASGVLAVQDVSEDENDTSAALPTEDDEGADDIRDEYLARELYPEDATAEVWSGKDEMMAEVLKSCLAEIGINCYVHTPDSKEDAAPDTHTDKSSVPFAVHVLPEDEQRARAIIRQVTDGAPPQ
jgi:hypothetical protein